LFIAQFERAKDALAIGEQAIFGQVGIAAHHGFQLGEATAGYLGSDTFLSVKPISQEMRIKRGAWLEVLGSGLERFDGCALA
jgi:hypothetical protein